MDDQPGLQARTTLALCVPAGIVAGGVAGALGAGVTSPLIGWDAAALVFIVSVWATVWPMDPEQTSAHAQREDPGRRLTDLVLLAAAVASVVSVATVLVAASTTSGDGRYVRAGLALASVFVTWTLIHTVFTLRYARLHCSAPAGGIDFNSREQPQYSDFAYLSFTIGMTFQVSDTDISSKEIRRMALRHALLSFPLGAVIIAASINLVSGLVK